MKQTKEIQPYMQFETPEGLINIDFKMIQEAIDKLLNDDKKFFKFRKISIELIISGEILLSIKGNDKEGFFIERSIKLYRYFNG